MPSDKHRGANSRLRVPVPTTSTLMSSTERWAEDSFQPSKQVFRVLLVALVLRAYIRSFPGRVTCKNALRCTLQPTATPVRVTVGDRSTWVSTRWGIPSCKWEKVLPRGNHDNRNRRESQLRIILSRLHTSPRQSPPHNVINEYISSLQGPANLKGFYGLTVGQTVQRYASYPKPPEQHYYWRAHQACRKVINGYPRTQKHPKRPNPKLTGSLDSPCRSSTYLRIRL